jgi:bifunctional non-homologous end joining protein LigD
VFLDYNQNAKDRTTCSAYSVRPLPDARVSTPLDWHEVPDCDPADFTIFTVPQRFAKIGDPHASMNDALIVVANSPDKAAALAGLERWKAKYAEVAGLLAIDDVLVDSMRGRSSTWTRIRVNLRHVSEALRPPQETPDPDDDPTREWREWRRKKTKR